MNASEGKTKIIERIGNHQVLLHTKDNLTAGNAAKEAKINNIGEYKTEQAANVFSLLNSLNIPTAFIKKQDKNTLLCYACGMLPLEIVVRRYAFGSYLKRNPEMKKENGAIRFDEPIVEFFHKESVVTPPLVEKACQMSEGEARSRFLHSGKWEEGVYADPLIIPKDKKWDLYDPYADLKDSKILMSINPELSLKDFKRIKRKDNSAVFLCYRKSVCKN
jgi:phosphoribosylaminoimidazole-succinocarboxamide synthase